MALRNITEKMVEDAILNPDKTGVGYEGKNLVFKKSNKGIIKIVFVRKKSSYVIVSVIWELTKRIRI